MQPGASLGCAQAGRGPTGQCSLPAPALSSFALGAAPPRSCTLLRAACGLGEAKARSCLFTGSTETTHPPSFAYIGLGTCPAPPSNSGLGWRCTRPTCPLFGSVSGSAEPVSGWVPAGPTVTFQGAGLTQRQPALTGASLMRSPGRRGSAPLESAALETPTPKA